MYLALLLAATCFVITAIIRELTTHYSNKIVNNAYTYQMYRLKFTVF